MQPPGDIQKTECTCTANAFIQALIAHRVKTTGNRATRRVHKNIEATEVLHHLLHALTASLSICDVSFHKPGLRPMRLDSRKKTIRQRNSLPGNHGDVSALTCQGDSGGSPDTAGTAGD